MRHLVPLLVALSLCLCGRSYAGCGQSDLTGNWSMYDDHNPDWSIYCSLTIKSSGKLQTGTYCYQYGGGSSTATKYKVTGGKISLNKSCKSSGSINMETDMASYSITIKQGVISQAKDHVTAVCKYPPGTYRYYLINLMKNK